MGSYSDERMQEELVEWLERPDYWKGSIERDHVIICQDPNALYKVIDQIRNAVLLVSDFGRLRGDQASLVKDAVFPYSHRINPYNALYKVWERRIHSEAVSESELDHHEEDHNMLALSSREHSPELGTDFAEREDREGEPRRVRHIVRLWVTENGLTRILQRVVDRDLEA